MEDFTVFVVVDVVVVLDAASSFFFSLLLTLRRTHAVSGNFFFRLLFTQRRVAILKRSKRMDALFDDLLFYSAFRKQKKGKKFEIFVAGYLKWAKILKNWRCMYSITVF